MFKPVYNNMLKFSIAFIFIFNLQGAKSKARDINLLDKFNTLVQESERSEFLRKIAQHIISQDNKVEAGLEHTKNEHTGIGKKGSDWRCKGDSTCFYAIEGKQLSPKEIAAFKKMLKEVVDHASSGKEITLNRQDEFKFFKDVNPLEYADLAEGNFLGVDKHGSLSNRIVAFFDIRAILVKMTSKEVDSSAGTFTKISPITLKNKIMKEHI